MKALVTITLGAAMTIAVADMAGAAPARAATIGFEDTGLSSGDFIADGYAGYRWSNFAVVNPSEDTPQSGWANGASGKWMAFNADAAPASIAGAAAFDLLGGNFVGAWNDGLQITAIGFIGADAVHRKTFTVGTAGASAVRFDWGGLSRVTLSSAGGITRYDVEGAQFGVDALQLAPTAPVPEPASWAMMLLGFAAVGRAMRHRRARRIPAAI